MNEKGGKIQTRKRNGEDREKVKRKKKDYEGKQRELGHLRGWIWRRYEENGGQGYEKKVEEEGRGRTGWNCF